MSGAVLEDQVRYDILKYFGLRQDMKLFANPCGNAWAGILEKSSREKVLLKHPRRISYGLEVGSSDLIGWITIEGRAVFLALELKSPTGRPSKEQLNWIEQVKLAGGIAGIVRSPQDVEKLIAEYKTRMSGT